MLLEEALWPSKSTPPLLVIEHDITRSPIPLLRTLISDSLSPNTSSKPTASTRNVGESKHKNGYQNVVLITFLHSPRVFVRPLNRTRSEEAHEEERLRILDWTKREFGGAKLEIHEFRVQWSETLQKLTNNGSLLFVIDSLDTMVLDLGLRHTLMFLQDVIEQIKARKAPSRILVSCSSSPTSIQPEPVINHILSASFTPSITHLRLYPPILFTHLSKVFLLPPPPRTPEAKFYGVFAGFVDRERKEGERLWYANLDEGEKGKAGNNGDVIETIVETVVRSIGLRKSVERSLEGWVDGKICALEEMSSLRECFAGTGLLSSSDVKDRKDGTDAPALELPFNLSLTEDQVAARAKVPLPYAHTGEGHETNRNSGKDTRGLAGAIYYDPDSADDLDEEDPDEDLDL